MLTLGCLDRPNDAQENMATVQDMATQAFVLKLKGVQDVVLSSYHRVFSDGFLEGWKQANAMSRIYMATDTIDPSVPSAASDMADNFSVSSPLQPETIIPGMAHTLINTNIATLEAETNPVDTTVQVAVIEPEHTLFDTIISANEPEHTPDATISAIEHEPTGIENVNTPIDSIDTLVNDTNIIINTPHPLIDLTPPGFHRPYRSQSSTYPDRPYPFLLPPHTNLNLQRPYIPTTPLHGILPPCDITPILPSLSPTPQPAYPNLFLPASSFDRPATASTTPPTATSAPPTSTTSSTAPPASSCLLTSPPSHTVPPISTPLPSLLLGPIPPTAILDWDTSTPDEPHAYFADKLDGRGGDRIHGSEYVDEVDTGARYMRLTFWEARAAERALEMFRGGYSCGGGVIWGWVWRG